MWRRLVETRRAILGGQMAEVAALESVDLDTELERRPTVLADLAGSTIVFEGKRVSFPERVAEELEAVVAADGPFTAGELPGSLDEQGRLVLVRRLVREGFLRRNGGRAC